MPNFILVYPSVRFWCGVVLVVVVLLLLVTGGKQSQLLVLSLSLKFDNKYEVLLDA